MHTGDRLHTYPVAFVAAAPPYARRIGDRWQAALAVVRVPALPWAISRTICIEAGTVLETVHTVNFSSSA